MTEHERQTDCDRRQTTANKQQTTNKRQLHDIAGHVAYLYRHIFGYAPKFYASRADSAACSKSGAYRALVGWRRRIHASTSSPSPSLMREATECECTHNSIQPSSTCVPPT
eukprot:scaffold5747_cov128-Isochrysis_galbana.AAC.1